MTMMGGEGDRGAGGVTKLTVLASGAGLKSPLSRTMTLRGGCSSSLAVPSLSTGLGRLKVDPFRQTPVVAVATRSSDVSSKRAGAAPRSTSRRAVCIKAILLVYSS